MIYPIEFREVTHGTIKLDIVETNGESQWLVVDNQGLFYAAGVQIASFKSFSHAVSFCSVLVRMEYPEAILVNGRDLTIKNLLDPELQVHLIFDHWSPKGSGTRADYNSIPCGADMNFHPGCSYDGMMVFPQDSLDGFYEGIQAGLDANFTVRLGERRL